MIFRTSALAAFALVLGCGATTPQKATSAPTSSPARKSEPVAQAPEQLKEVPASGATSTEPEPEPELVGAIPQNCSTDEGECVPPEAFARAACSGHYPGMALIMFGKSTPWQRLYVKAEFLDPVNAYDGPVSTKRMVFGEELLVLKKEAAAKTSGIQMTGSSDIDLLRWDGSCVTARREMFVTYRMPETKNATINWRTLDASIQAGLMEAKYVNVRRKSQREACRGSSESNPSEKCAKAIASLNEAITVAIRGGLALPSPDKLPLWVTEAEAVALAKTD
jgi:hypothetical protein